MEDCHIYGQVSQTCLLDKPAAFKKTFKKDWKIKMFKNGGTECYTLTCPENYIVVFQRYRTYIMGRYKGRHSVS